MTLPSPVHVDMRVALAPGEHEDLRHGPAHRRPTIEIRTRAGTTARIDAASAKSKFDLARPWLVGHALMARGTIGSDGTMNAGLIVHAKDSPKMWLTDR